MLWVLKWTFQWYGSFEHRKQMLTINAKCKISNTSCRPKNPGPAVSDPDQTVRGF